ncbi:YceI-like domain protein [compost metagenome]
MRSITSTDQAKPESNKRVDNELKSVSFFEVDKYPRATMLVKSVMAAVKRGTFTIEGNLTIKNITHPISFLASIQRNGNSLVATAQFSIDRMKWGIHQTKPPLTLSDQFFSAVKDKLIADEIPINLLLIFKKR